jgi:hypothetical protein
MIDILEVECNILCNLELNYIFKESLSMASKNRDTKNSSHGKFKEEEIVHQLRDPMNIEKQISLQIDDG